MSTSKTTTLCSFSILSASIALTACAGFSDQDHGATDAPDSDASVVDLAVEEHPLFANTRALWPKKSADTGVTRTVNVCWDTTGFATEKGWVRTAIEREYNSRTPLRFSGWGTCSLQGDRDIRITVMDAGAHTRALGRNLDNVDQGMVLNFSFANWSTNCSASEAARRACIDEIAVHEFGHAAGLAHEQNRPDTSAPNTNNACTDAPQGENGDLAFTAWDPESVMNYCNPVHDNGGVLSRMDVEGLNAIYGGTTSIVDRGYPDLPRFLVDVNADRSLDFCRFVGDSPNIFLSCKLGTANGFERAEYGFNSMPGIELGDPTLPRYMADVDADGRADFCRIVGSPRFLSCVLAGPAGFWAVQHQFNSVQGLDVGASNFPRALVDVNGDSRADFCRLVGTPAFISCNLARTDGSGFESNQYGYNTIQGIDLGYAHLPRGFERIRTAAGRDLSFDFCRYVGNFPAIARACNAGGLTAFSNRGQYGILFPVDACADYNGGLQLPAPANPNCNTHFAKHGNNGTVSCNTFCQGAQWGRVGTCRAAIRSDNQQRLACSTVPGLLPNAAELTCSCDP